MKIALALLAFLCVLTAVLQIYTLPTEFWWPASMISRELWPLLVVANAAGVVLAAAAWRPLSVVFIGCLAVSLWPLTQVSRVAADMRQQWSKQGFAEQVLPSPGLGEVFRASFGGHLRHHVAPEVLPLNIHLYRASRRPGPGRLPILVNIHGGSWQQGSPEEDATFTSYFARKGWAVFSLDYRLAPQWNHPAQLDDVLAALNWIVAHGAEYGADTSRIALAGRSAGGHLALLAAYASERFPIRSVVGYYAPSDLAGAYADPPVPDPLRVRERMEIFLGSTPRDSPKVYRDASPITYLRPQLPPTLQIHGVHDCIVKVRFARSLHEGLLSQGNRSLLLEIPWSDHAFDFVYFGAGNALALPYVEAFLNATVGERQ